MAFVRAARALQTEWDNRSKFLGIPPTLHPQALTTKQELPSLARYTTTQGRLEFTINNQNNLKMVWNRSAYFPIAPKASGIDFDKDIFKKLKLATNNRN